MRPGGVLLLLTPNVRSLNARLFPKEWEWTSPPIHLHLFTPTSISRVLVKAGFRIRHLGTARGNAKGFLFELLRSGVHHMARPVRFTSEGEDPPELRATQGWYRAAQIVMDIVSVPFYVLIPPYRVLGLAPEIRVEA